VANKTDPYLLQRPTGTPIASLQVCNIIKTEFGADKSRVRCIANSQASSILSMTNAIMKCTVAATALAQPCAKSIDAVAIAPYFGSLHPRQLKSRPVVATWYASADGGLEPDVRRVARIRVDQPHAGEERDALAGGQRRRRRRAQSQVHTAG
jgi:hypothetical protein